MIPENDIFKNFSVVFRRVQMFLDKELKDTNIRSGQVPILRILAENDGISQDQIRHILHVDRSSIAKTIRPLLAEGYLRREVNPEDKRAYKIFLTDKGRAVAPIIEGKIAQWEKIVFEGVDKENLDAFFHILKQVSGNAFNYFDKIIK